MNTDDKAIPISEECMKVARSMRAFALTCARLEIGMLVQAGQDPNYLRGLKDACTVVEQLRHQLQDPPPKPE